MYKRQAIEKKNFPEIPFGTCYLLGHCIAEGFKNAGYKSREVTGELLIRDKNEKQIIYGEIGFPVQTAPSRSHYTAPSF